MMHQSQITDICDVARQANFKKGTRMRIGNWIKNLSHQMGALFQNKDEDKRENTGERTRAHLHSNANNTSSPVLDKRQLALNFKQLGDTALGKRDFLNAYANYKKAIASDSGYANPYNNLAVTYLIFGYGSLDEALHAVKQCTELDPGIDQAWQNLAYLLLLKGDYKQGWAIYEQRLVHAKNKNDVSRRNIRAAIDYFGEERYLHSLQQLAGKKIIVWTEQGLGDFLMGFRYLSLLKQLGCTHLTILSLPELATLSQDQDCVDQVILEPTEIDAKDIDLHCSIMSLFSLFHDAPLAANQAISFPYLKIRPPTAQLTIPKTRGKPLVGLTWYGNPKNDLDYLRSIDTNQITPLLEIDDVEWISLQKGEDHQRYQADLALTGNLNWKFINLCATLEETAQLISQLDLIITVDTSIAHLAGALGKQTWLLNRYQSEWRWGLTGEQTHWYPTMTLFRQQEIHDWPGVVTQVKARLTMNLFS